MSEYQAFDPTLYLEHYGVLGMKWGIRKDRQGTYDKASAKLKKLDTKSQVYRNTANKYKQKYYQKEVDAQTSTFFKRRKIRKAGQLATTAYTNDIKANRMTVKAYNWSKKMDSVFKNGTKVRATDPEARKIGEKYAKMTIADLQNNSKQSTAFLNASRNAFSTSGSYKDFAASLNDPDAWKKYNQYYNG